MESDKFIQKPPKTSVQFIQTSPEVLADLMSNHLFKKLNEFKESFKRSNDDEGLLTREETCELLKINSSTLWAWTNKGKVKAYAIGARRYYKRSEIMASLIPVEN